MNISPEIFDSNLRKLKLKRSAKTFQNHSFLHDELAERITFNFKEILKTNFDNCLILGPNGWHLEHKLKNCSKIKNIFQLEDSENLPEEEYDLVVSNLALQWINDLPDALFKIRKSLKQGGFFLATFAGGQTLKELRESLVISEGRNNITSARTSPYIDVKDGAALLQKVGYKEPISHSDIIDIKYDNFYDLLYDLRYSGESNSLIKRNKITPKKDLFKNAEEYYIENFSDEDEALNATFEVVTISGWRS